MNRSRLFALVLAVTGSMAFAHELEAQPPSVPPMVEYADGFAIERRGELTVIRLSEPSTRELGLAEGSHRIVVVPQGIAPPELDADLTGAVVIEQPVGRVALNAESDEAFLDALGAAGRLVAVGGLISYNDEIREAASSGRLGQLGYSWHAPPNLDVALQRAPDVFFMRLASLDHAPSLARARRLGIPTVPVLLNAETTYLGRAEWIKFFGAILGLESEAGAIFETVKRRVLELRELVAGRAHGPAVLWAYYFGSQRWIATVRGPYAQLLRDAGGVNPLAQPEDPRRSSEEPVSTERLLQAGATADCWIIGDVHSVGQPSTRVMDGFRAWREGCLWGNTKRSKPDVNAYDWYETGVVRPDLVLEDLVSLLHPDLLDKEPDFFIRLARDGAP